MPRLPVAPLLALGAALFLATACQTTSADRAGGGNLLPADAAPGTYWSGEHSQAAERAYVVARTPGDWTELWARVGREAPSSLPSDRMAVAVFMGPRDTAGYAVSIDRAQVQGGDLVIGYHEQVPGPAQVVALVRTSPYAVRLLPKTDGAPKFQREK